MAHDANTKRYHFHLQKGLSDQVIKFADEKGETISKVLHRCIADYFSETSPACKAYSEVLFWEDENE